jgi:hypothetical protein
MSTHRTVIYQKRFEDELRALGVDPQVADAFIRGTEWVLCKGRTAPHTDKCLGAGGFPSVTVRPYKHRLG